MVFTVELEQWLDNPDNKVIPIAYCKCPICNQTLETNLYEEIKRETPVDNPKMITVAYTRFVGHTVVR